MLYFFLFLLFLGAFAFIIFLLSLTIIADFMGAPYVWSGRKETRLMVELAELRPGDIAVDLGSGDGAILFEAAQQEARARGVEFNPFLVWWSRMRGRIRGLSRLVTIERGNFWNYPLGDANVLFLYLMPATLAKLRKKLEQELKPGTRVVSHAFPIPDWTPAKKQGNIFLYIHPLSLMR